MSSNNSKSAMSKSPNAKRTVTPASTPGKNSPYQPLNGVSTKSNMTAKSKPSKISRMMKRSKKDKNLPGSQSPKNETESVSSTSPNSNPSRKTFFSKLMKKSKRKNKKEAATTTSVMETSQDDGTSDGQNSNQEVDYKVEVDPELERTTFEKVAVKEAKPAIVDDFRNGNQAKQPVLGVKSSPGKPTSSTATAKLTNPQQKQVWMKK